MIQGWGAREANPTDKSVRTFGAQCVEVEVDIETGEVTILRVVAAHDCGRIVNPTLVDSQVIGGVTQGIGFALIEERVDRRGTGIVLNANLEEYKVPTVADIRRLCTPRSICPTLRRTRPGQRASASPRWCRLRPRLPTRSSMRWVSAYATRRSRVTGCHGVGGPGGVISTEVGASV